MVTVRNPMNWRHSQITEHSEIILRSNGSTNFHIGKFSPETKLHEPKPLLASCRILNVSPIIKNAGNLIEKTLGLDINESANVLVFAT